MVKKFKINKNRCIGCGTCVQTCDNATKIGDDMKAEIISQEKLEECGGAKVCPFGAIEEVEEDKAKK
jgi:ferredoxin